MGMAIVMTNLGFEPKGRRTIRRVPSANREPRRSSPWAFEPKENTTLAKLERVYLDALESVDAIEDRKKAAVDSKKFTDDGIVDYVLQFAASTLAPRLHRARLAVEAAKQEAQARREKLALKPADKTDAAGQMRRLWKLDKFNALPDQERNAYIARNIDTLDPELVQAFLELPDYAKVLPSDLEQIRERALVAQHGEQALAEQREFEEGVAIAEDTIAAAREAVAHDAGGLEKFNTFAAPYERAATAPWLRKIMKDGVERIEVFKIIDNSGWGGRWLEPSAAELEEGVFYRNAYEWRRAKGEEVAIPKERANGAG